MRMFQRLQNLQRDLGDVTLVDVLEQDRELIAAEAGDGVGLS